MSRQTLQNRLNVDLVKVGDVYRRNNPAYRDTIIILNSDRPLFLKESGEHHANSNILSDFVAKHEYEFMGNINNDLVEFRNKILNLE